MSSPFLDLGGPLLHETAPHSVRFHVKVLAPIFLLSGICLSALLVRVTIARSLVAQYMLSQTPASIMSVQSLRAVVAQRTVQTGASMPSLPAEELTSLPAIVVGGGVHGWHETVTVTKEAGVAVPFPCGRRALLAAAALAPCVPTYRTAAAEVVLRVVPGAPRIMEAGAPFASVAEAVARAPAGATVLVAPGVYTERLVLDGRISQGLTIRAENPEAGATVLEHTTNSPYEATVESAGASVLLQGFTIRHSSPSIAQNYGVFVKAGGALVLEGCDLTSATGSALGVEGGDVTLRRCRLHDAKNNGAALYGDILGEQEPQLLLEDCRIDHNRLDGVLARDGASPKLRRNEVVDNGDYGVALSGSAATLQGNTLKGNKKGSLIFQQNAEVSASVDDSNVFDSKPTIQ